MRMDERLCETLALVLSADCSEPAFQPYEVSTDSGRNSKKIEGVYVLQVEGSIRRRTSSWRMKWWNNAATACIPIKPKSAHIAYP